MRKNHITPRVLFAVMLAVGCDAPSEQDLGRATGASMAADAGSRSDAARGASRDGGAARRAERRFRATAAGYELDTSEPDVRFVVRGSSVYLVRGTERILVIEPARFERDGRAIAAEPDGSVHERGSRLSFGRAAGVEEWYEPHADGLEQGWTLDRPLESGGPLRIALRLGPEVTVLEPSDTPPSRDEVDEGAEPRDDRIVLLVRDILVSYSNLSVTDADGRSLVGTLRANASEIMIDVDDAAARFPVTIDPLVALAETSVPASYTPARTSDWGSALAVDGSNLFVGIPDLPAGAGMMEGGVNQYSWNGSDWTLVRRIRIAGTDTSTKFGFAVAARGDWLVVSAYANNTAYAIRLSSGFSGSSSAATPNAAYTLTQNQFDN